MMFRLVIFAIFAFVFVSCAPKVPKTEPQTQTIIAGDTARSTIVDTIKITDSIYVKETESFKALQKSIDSLIANRETEKAIVLLKKQVHYHNNLDQLGFRTLQLANLLHQTGHSAEALAILETFAVYKPAINTWIDSANALYDKITTVNKNRTAKIDSEKLEIINSLTAQIRNLKNTNMNPALITDLADSLRSIAPGDSVLAWLEKQIPSQIETSDSFCEEQRKIAAASFAASRKNKAKANALLAEAIEALDKCLAKTPSADMRKKVAQNREVLAKELKTGN
jgi:tetratricopeptide (TPR) repeat protein